MLFRFILIAITCSFGVVSLAESQQEPETSIKKSWGHTHWLWNFGFASESDIGLVEPKELYTNYLGNHFNPSDLDKVKSGDIVWIRAAAFQQFYKEALPKLKAPIVLIINDGDECFPATVSKGIDIEAVLANKNIIHIFAQNCDYSGSSNKISHLPIGIDFHTIAYRDPENGFWGQKGSPMEQERILDELLKTLQPTYLRKKRAYVDFQLNDSMRNGYCRLHVPKGENRESIYKKIIKTNLIDYGPQMSRGDLWKRKGQCAFSVSPHGNGLDCHRTWEDLVLGCIVIVKTSPLDPLYEGLPVVIVKDWEEVNQENFDLWIKKYGDAFTNPEYREKLTHKYWMKKIRAAAEPYKNIKGHVM
jgi:hypothetical protein